MYGGIRGKANWGLVLGVVGLFAATPAFSADLGGDCCADLEERVAELEATVARKGNRKVSLTVSGWVNEAVFWWDDGEEQNVYVGTNSLEQSRFRFSGEAKIDKDWSAGYLLEVGLNGAVSSQFDQFDAQGASTSGAVSTVIRKSYWYVKNKTYGQLSVGQNGSATYHLLDDADATNTRSFSDAEAAAVAINNFFIVSNGVVTATRWNQVLRGFNNGTPGQAGRREVVRYDSPDFHGLTLQAAWGADDLWDVAITFKKDIGDFKVLSRVGYGNSTDDYVPPAGPSSGTLCGGPSVNFECEWAGGAATVMHNPTGLYLYGGFGWQKIDSLPAGFDDTSTTWFIQPGIEHKWLALGKTTIFGEFRHDEPGARFANGSATPSALGADIEFWAAGVVQNIDAAAMDLYAIYRHSEGDYTKFVAGVGGVLTPIDDFDMVITGAKISF